MTRPTVDDSGPGLDLRVLIAALVAWAVTAVAVALPPVASTIATGLAVTLAAILLWRRRAGDRSGADSHARAHGRWRGRGRRDVELGVALAAVALGCTLTAVAGHLAVRRAGLVPGLAAARATVRMVATVESDPRLVGPGHGDTPMVVTKVRVTQIAGRGNAGGARTPVLVFGDEDWLDLHWQEDIEFSGRLDEADAGDDVEAVARAHGAPRVRSPAPWLVRRVEAVRASFRDVTAALPADPRGLVPALVIGDTARLPGDLNDDMRATGMTHLNAVSGSNVTFVAAAAAWACAWLRIPRRGRAPAVVVALGVFVLLCRPEPSVIRAAVMGGVGLVGLTAARVRAGPPALGAAIIVLLVWDPWLSRSFGFALSSLATLGLLLFARPWGKAIASRLPRRAARLGEAIAIPVAAQALCAPVIVVLQGTVSLVGLPANLLAAPLVAPATLAGVGTAVLAPVAPWVARWTAWGAALPAWGIAQVAHVCARVPFGSVPWLPGAVGAITLAGIVLALVLSGPWLVDRVRRHPVAAALVVISSAGAWWPVHRSTAEAAAVFVACDVGQGDAGVLPTGHGHAVLVDVGPDDDLVDGCLSRLGIRVIDTIVLTHFHADHVGGLVGASRGRAVGQIIVTPVMEGASGAQRGDAAGDAPLVFQVARQRGIPVRTVHQGDRLVWGGVTATVLWPTSRTVHEGSVQNNASVTLDVHAGGLRLLLAGDLEKEAAAGVRRYLDQHGGVPTWDVLKVAHHGSANQDADLVRAIHAAVAVISVGAHNDYGHPAPRTLSLLAAAGSAVFRTDRGGDVRIVAVAGRPWVGR